MTPHFSFEFFKKNNKKMIPITSIFHLMYQIINTSQMFFLIVKKKNVSNFKDYINGQITHFKTKTANKRHIQRSQ
jgi:hypothetical protein